MPRIELTALLKLGTGLRYLIDVREGMTLGGKHVLQNCHSVLELIPKAGLSQTAESAPYEQLKQLCGELETASTERVTLNAAEAERLVALARRIRDGLYTEARGRYVHLGRGPLGFQVALTLMSLLVLSLFAALAPGYLDGLDPMKPWLVAAAVLVMALTGIWSSRGLEAPALWLGFIALIATIIYAASGG